MYFSDYIFALSIFHSRLVLAQQKCYWPDGSGVRPNQGYWVNCYPSQASTCCKNGEVCLSNGLCYGSEIDMVRPRHPSSYLEPGNNLVERFTEADALSKTGVIQLPARLSGAMMVKTLSMANLGTCVELPISPR